MNTVDENIMINFKTRQIKLIDFGSCNTLQTGRKVKLFYGTKKFASPESLLNDYYNPEAQEVWALGTLLFVVLFKMDPFKTDQDIIEIDIAQKIYKLRIGGYHGGKQFDISEDAVKALLSMLNKNPNQRITLPQILKLPFFSVE